MPRGDRTGPGGLGAGTGRGAGYCMGYDVPGVYNLNPVNLALVEKLLMKRNGSGPHQSTI